MSALPGLVLSHVIFSWSVSYAPFLSLDVWEFPFTNNCTSHMWDFISYPSYFFLATLIHLVGFCFPQNPTSISALILLTVYFCHISLFVGEVGSWLFRNRKGQMRNWVPGYSLSSSHSSQDGGLGDESSTGSFHSSAIQAVCSSDLGSSAHSFFSISFLVDVSSVRAIVWFHHRTWGINCFCYTGWYSDLDHYLQ